jgi:ABC-type dipeptide/oligopeptide/nickel transport system permease component
LTPNPLMKSNQLLSALARVISRRLLLTGLVLLTIIYLTYLGLGMARGQTFLASSIQAVENTILYLGRLSQGDLGLSSAGSITLLPVPVIEVIPSILIRSFGLLGVSLIAAASVGTLLGIISAFNRRSKFSLIILVASVMAISLPSFLLALLLQIIVIQLNRYLGYNLLSVGGFGWDKRILLPALVLAARPLAQISRITYITIEETLDQDYIRTAWSKGLKGLQVLLTHIMRNAAIPILTTIGISLRFSLSSLPVVEYFFSWQGLGYTLLKTIARQDENLTIALLLCLAALFMVVNVLLDISYRVIDPRLREPGGSAQTDESISVSRDVQPIFQTFFNKFRRKPLKNWFWGNKAYSSPSPFKILFYQREQTYEQDYIEERTGERNAWIQGTIRNTPFVVGGLLLLLLSGFILFGPSLAVHSPYKTEGMIFKNGQFSVPPFAPGQDYPWGTDVLGRDIQSLILTGAQQTLLLASLVMAARLGMGFALGALAGWYKEKWIDRAVLTAAEVISAFPTLLLAMTLVIAFGIRSGMPPFILALCLVGWGEIMQQVRAEIIQIRPRLFIESAYALGVNPSRIIVKHILPNLVPTLLAIAALEMGAVLMLLGELGFIGIFIGGGAFAELDFSGPAYHYSDVPEWGALLSNIRTYARSYPWTAIYPSMAFFISILAFNLFGEGLRRFILIVGVHLTRVVNRYSLICVVVIIGGFIWYRGGTGAITIYHQQAASFDVEQVMTTLDHLTSAELEGRALGSQGHRNAAEYIAQEFKKLGLQPAGEQMTYFQTRQREFVTLTSIPTFDILDSGVKPVYQEDYAEYAQHQSQGNAEGNVRAFAVGELSVIGQWGQYYQALKNLDYSEEILLVCDPEDLLIAQMLPRAGILYASDEEIRIETISPRIVQRSIWGGFSLENNASPILVVSQKMANRILASSGMTVKDLRRQAGRLNQDELFEVPLAVRVAMGVEGKTREGVEARHVIGHMPGTAGTGETKLDDKLIVVLANYDSPPSRPDGSYLAAANDNASAIAVMLEIVRVMNETGYRPNRSFLFVAFSGEGLEGGVRVFPRVSKLLQTKFGFSSSYEIEAIIDLRGLGSAEGKELVIYSGGNQRLEKLVKRAAFQNGVPVLRARENVNISVVFEEQKGGGQEAPNIRVSWSGWEANSHLPTDTLENISPTNLEKAGRVICLALMLIGRETIY